MSYYDSLLCCTVNYLFVCVTQAEYDEMCSFFSSSSSSDSLIRIYISFFYMTMSKLQNLSKQTRKNVSILYTHIHTSIRTCTNEKERGNMTRYIYMSDLGPLSNRWQVCQQVRMNRCQKKKKKKQVAT